ncbi:hypothetical protein [Myxococcus xanthus]|nr:hypothetical protein [Myxococcus xanthus]
MLPPSFEALDDTRVPRPVRDEVAGQTYWDTHFGVDHQPTRP